jgi:Outer membrane protein beta-barrel domain
MKKTIHIFLLLLASNSILLAQIKTDTLKKASTTKRITDYPPIFFGIYASLQSSLSKVEGSANITTAQKQYLNWGIYAGYRFRKHKFDLGLTLGNSNNNWSYTNPKLAVTVRSNQDRATLNVRFGYNYRLFKLNDRWNIDLGAGISSINIRQKDTLFTYPSEAFTKLISALQERLLEKNSLAFDGKIQVNYALNTHLQLHFFGQYRYAPTYMRRADITYFDAITGVKQDMATVKSSQTTPLFGIGLQYNLRPILKKQ